MKVRPVLVALFVLAAIVIFAYRYLGSHPQEHVFYPMGGIPCKIVTYDAAPGKFATSVKLVEKKVEDFENILNVHRQGSEISHLNGSPANTWHKVSPELYNILERSLAWYGRSNGAFDVTVEPLIEMWEESAKKRKVPSDAEISASLKKVGASSIILSPEKGVKFQKSGMALTFGGIAKGYILDRVGKILQDNGVDVYVVSCGGDVVMKGRENFRVGIQEPGGGPDKLMIVFTMSAGAVSTSGHYERFYKIGDKEYSHIIDPKTGMSVENDLVSITIAGSNATDADALATSVAVLGLEKGMELIKNFKGFQGILVRKTPNGHEIYYSSSIKDKLLYNGEWADVPKKEF